MRKYVIYLSLTILLISSVKPVYADYILPYPSYMPGNKIYRIMRIVDQLKRYWYWGNIGQIKYHMELSDKYLVEAKTLMEYNQYLLATDSLVRSDKEFMQLPKYVEGAKNEGVDVSGYKKMIVEEGQKHIEVLSILVSEVPQEFTWTPEKAKATDLKLRPMLNDSIEIRTLVVSQSASL